MPLFEYQCNQCRYRFDKMVQRFDTKVTCPVCQGDVQKLMSTFSVGQAQQDANNLPPELRPKMCTNC